MSKETQKYLMKLLVDAQKILMSHPNASADNAKAIVMLEDVMHLVDVE
jgi:hypothetical protein